MGRRIDRIGIGVATIILVTSFVWGGLLQRRERRIKLGAAPFAGQWDVRLSWRILPAVVVGAFAVVVLPTVMARLRFRLAVWLSGFTLAAFALALAASDGANAILAPVVHSTEYWANLASLQSAGEMLRSFSSYEFLVDRSVHLKGHPPGFILLLKGLAALGLGQPWVAGALSFLGAMTVVVAVSYTTRSVCGEGVARLSLPFFACAPFALWLGTSADAFFTAVCAWGIASLVLALQAASRKGRLLLSTTGGVLLAGGLFLSYGVVPLLALPILLVLRSARRRPRHVAEVVIGAGIGAILVTAAFARSGFSWFDGLALTRQFYWNGSAYFRTWTYFMIANIGVLMLALGPAVVAGVWRLRERAVWFIVGGVLLGLTAAEVSQYSKGEVERIWLLFMPWLVPAVSSLAPRSANSSDGVLSSVANGVHRAWLAGQVGLAVVLQLVLRSKW